MSPPPGTLAAGEPRLFAETPIHAFAINLIRRQVLPQRIRRWLLYAMLGYVALNVAVATVLVGVAFDTHERQQRLQRALHGMMAPAVSTDALQQEMLTLRDHALEELASLNTITALQRRRFPVGAKLAALTNTLPARTWIVELSADHDHRRLVIEASYVIEADRPFEVPAKRWIEALQADTHFSRGLKQVQLGDSSRKMQGRAELFSFTLNAEWQP